MSLARTNPEMVSPTEEGMPRILKEWAPNTVTLPVLKDAIRQLQRTELLLSALANALENKHE